MCVIPSGVINADMGLLQSARTPARAHALVSPERHQQMSLSGHEVATVCWRDPPTARAPTEWPARSKGGCDEHQVELGDRLITVAEIERVEVLYHHDHGINDQPRHEPSRLRFPTARSSTSTLSHTSTATAVNKAINAMEL